MVTLKDIAKAAGVSTSAVCKALRGGYDVSDELRSKVNRLVKELDYKPNMLARAFRTNRTYNIGVYYGFEAAYTITHSFFSNVLNAFCNKLAKEGYDLTYISSRIGNTKSAIIDHCRMKKFEAVLLACVNYNDPSIANLIDSEIPIVCIDNYFGKGIGVTSDNYNGMQMLVEYCIESGHKDICFVHGQDGYTTEQRKKAFFDTVKTHRLTIATNRIIEGEYYSSERTERIFTQLMSEGKRPTCIIFPDDFCAAVAIKIAKNMNISIPDDVSIAGYDSAEFSSLISPNVTTIAQDAKTIGQIAAKNIICLVEKNIETKEFIVPVTLIKGETIKQI